MALTRQGLQALAAALVLFGMGVGLGFEAVRLLAGVALGAVVSAAVIARGRPSVRVEREVHPQRVERGQAAVARLEVRNVGVRRAAAFTAREHVGDSSVEVQVPALAPDAAMVRTYRLPTERRGRLDIGPLTLLREDPLGLVHAVIETGAMGALLVHPRTHLMRPLEAGRTRQYDGLANEDAPRGSTTFHALREYVIGDELRHVHWRTSARTGQLMIREHLDPHQPRLTVILDTAQEAYGADEESFEEAVEIAASLVRSFADPGHPTRLLTTDGVDRRTEDARLGARGLLDELSGVRALPAPPQRRRVRQLLTHSDTGSCLAFVTSAVTQEVLAELAPLQGRFPWVVVFDVAAGSTAAAAAGVTLVREPLAEQAAVTWNAMVTQ